MLAGESRALRGHRVLEPAQMAPDAVDLPFHQQRLACVEDFPLGLVEAEQDAALAEDRRLGRVDVFAAGLVVDLQHAPAEADGAAEFVADGEHDPAAEPVVEIAFFVGRQQARRFQRLHLGAVARAGRVGQESPAFRRIADAPVLAGGDVQRAFLEVIARRRGFRTLEQFLLVALGGVLVRGKQLVLPRPVLRAGALFIDLERDARPRGQHPQGRREIHVVVEHHELEHVAAGAAAEAVERLAGRIDVEGRRFFLVERAQRLRHVPRALELDIGTDDVGDIQRVADLVDRFLGDHSRHGRSTPRGTSASSGEGLRPRRAPAA